jgi:hypothetical protein
LVSVLGQLAQDSALRERAAFVDASVQVTLKGSNRARDTRSITLDFRRRRDGELPGAPHLQLFLSPGVAHPFLLGDAHEALLLLSGDLSATGPLDALLRLIRAVRPISSRYREIAGQPLAAPARVAVLRRYNVTRELVGGLPVPTAIEASVIDHQVWMAALVLVGIHPACRRLELAAILQADVPQARIVSLATCLSALASAGSGTRLAGVTRSIKALEDEAP